MHVWTYVISSDSGSAPNFEPPFATLAICKPRIRRRAGAGDLMIAFNGSNLHPEPHSVRWAGIVKEVIELGSYWSDPRFRSKRPDKSRVPDNIYRRDRGVLTQVPNTVHSVANVATDVAGENALVFEQYWYFGDAAPILPEGFGLWMVNGRRHEPRHKLEPDHWRALRDWLIGTRQMLGLIEPPTGEPDLCSLACCDRVYPRRRHSC